MGEERKEATWSSGTVASMLVDGLLRVNERASHVTALTCSALSALFESLHESISIWGVTRD
jgi:hypothetical protein